MTRQRVVLLLLAIVLVYVGTITIVQIPYQRIYHGIMNPRADAKDVSRQLQSDNALTRRQGLDAYHYGLQDDSEVMSALVQTVLHDTDEENRLHALKLLIGKTSVHLSQQKKQAPLRTTDIDQLISLITVDSIPEDLFWSLIQFAANTAQWQSAPGPVLELLSSQLIETSPVAGEERHAAYAREEKQRSVLLALKAYARYMTLSDQTLETVLPLYTAPPTQRLRTEVGYLYQYYAINGPLPDSVRQAVVHTMQNSDDKNMRLTAIMTMEWIGKQEGQIPPEMLETLKENKDDSWTISQMNHVIIRMQKYFDDPLRSLLAVAGNTAIPDSIRANALREAGKSYSLDSRFNEAVTFYLKAGKPALKAAAIGLMPDTAEHIDDTLAKIDISLTDTDPGMRIIALRKLIALHIPDKEKITRFEQALNDEDEDVVIWAAKTIKNTRLSSDDIQQHLAQLKNAGKLQQLEKKQSPELWQSFVTAMKDTRRHGVRLYWLLAATGIAMAAIFSIYYMYHLLITVQQHKSRALRIIGILIVWTGLTYAMVALFFLGAFMFGHNSLVAPRQQFTIDAMASAALLVYGFFGWALSRLVRK